MAVCETLSNPKMGGGGGIRLVQMTFMLSTYKTT